MAVRGQEYTRRGGLTLEQMNRLWEYQLVDLQASQYETDLRTSETYKRYVKLRRYLDEQKRILQRMNDAVEERNAQIARAKERYAILEQRYQDGMDKYERVDKENAREVERFCEYFEQLNARLAQERQELQKLATELEKEDSQLASMRGQLAKARKDFDETKREIADAREAYKGDVDALQERAEAIAKGIDADLLAKYSAAKKSFPAPLANVARNRCMGCNMELSVALLRRLRDGGEIVECENCGRMLRFVEEDNPV